MDIFVANIKDNIPDNTVKKYLRKKLKYCGIDIFEYKKLKSRGCAIVTVLDIVNGREFVRRNIQSLVFHNRTLHLDLGKKTPDAFQLRSLEKSVKDFEASKKRSQTKNRGDDDKLQLDHVSCGVWAYNEDGLTFIPHFTDGRRAAVVFGEKELMISVPDLDENTATSLDRIDVPYSWVNSVATGTVQDPTMTLTLEKSPRVYVLNPDTRHNLLMRLAGLPEERRFESVRKRGINAEHESVTGYCWVYRLRLRFSADYYVLQRLLEQRPSLPEAFHGISSQALPRNSIRYDFDMLNSKLDSYEHFDFCLRFQLQKLVHNCYLLPATVYELLPHVSSMVQNRGLHETTYALKKLFNRIEYAGPGTDFAAFTIDTLKGQLIEILEEDDRDPMRSLLRRHENLLLVHKIQVTPAGLFLEGPELESKNRVLRKYPGFASEYFVRLAFLDDDGSSIRYDRAGSLANVHGSFKSFLREPITIAGREFRFLGFSNSSLREQGCWYMASFTHNGKFLSARTVVAGLGNFAVIRSPAKCAARIGQAFTDTPHGTTSLPTSCVRRITDIERNGRVFSDGCGTISQDLIEKLWKNYRLGVLPTLFQIRYAGSKGMISLDSRLNGELLNYRPSMCKFDAAHTDIEICGSARKPLPCFLNRQLIKVLEDLGVSAQSFLDLQTEAVQRLRITAQHPLNASSFLERDGIGRSTQLPWMIERLFYQNIPCLEDKFIRQCVEHTVLGQLRQLKHKARIPVEKGVMLFGIMDETDTLLENEIFCRKSGKTIIGQVTISRHPALHPGDVQKVLAVDVPSLSPLKQLDNCVVFSQRGQRDLPSQLSGGDLDGDQFPVIFDERLQPQETVVAADYPRVSPVDLFRVVNVNDMTDFFVDFMANDQLGRIANMHMQLADQAPLGTRSPDCVKLAEMHSTAVDFQKTGIAVDMSQKPRMRKCKPDFMAPSPRMLTVGQKLEIDEDNFALSDDEGKVDDAVRPGKGDRRTRFYESSKALGQLYRAIDERAFLDELQSESTRSGGETVMQKLWAYVQKHSAGIEWKHLVEEAKVVKRE